MPGFIEIWHVKVTADCTKLAQWLPAKVQQASLGQQLYLLRVYSLSYEGEHGNLVDPFTVYPFILEELNFHVFHESDCGSKIYDP